MNKIYTAGTIRFDPEADKLEILDQTLLPGMKQYTELKNAKEVAEAILALKVRGAPAIGVAAAYGVYVSVRNAGIENFDDFEREFDAVSTLIESSRPTAVNLSWAVKKMRDTFAKEKDNENIEKVLNALKACAISIDAEDREMSLRIGENGLELFSPGMGILTHCNAGALATAGCGTALAPIYLGNQKGYAFKVFSDETRPLLQGARLTSFELQESGADVTLLCDNMAATTMKSGKIGAVIVGADRIAANGDTANKIGTLGVAILAHFYNIPFYVAAPSSTFDLSCVSGDGIPIEQRNPDEVSESWYRERMAPEGIKIENPAFDVTNNELITAIITEKGIIKAPFGENIRKMFE